MRVNHIGFALLLALILTSRANSAATTNAVPAAAALPVVDSGQKRLALLKAQPLAVQTIFSDDKFPKIDLLNRALVEAAVGPVTQNVRFFDAQWNEVATPKIPGRYGVLVTFTAGDLNWRQHATLYKTPGTYRWAAETYQVQVKFPQAFGLSPDLLASEQWNLNDCLATAIGQSESQSDRMARLLAALQAIRDDPARWHGFNIASIDNAWWSELYRRLGENQDYPYLSYLPAGYANDTKAWPLIVFLHGSGERGADLNKVKDKGPLGYIHRGHPLPFIVITPQCPDDERWDPVRLSRLLDKIEATDRVDPKRIFITGLSLGGYATFELAATYPGRIAAIAPLSGGETPDIALRLRHTPTWIFHGAEDDVVPTRYSVDIAHALQKLGAPVKLTIYPGVGHEKWDVTYSDPALYSWFLSQSK